MEESHQLVMSVSGLRLLARKWLLRLLLYFVSATDLPIAIAAAAAAAAAAIVRG